MSERINRARELIALSRVHKITIGWEGDFTTFTPADATPPKFIEEVTLLSREIRALMEGRIK